MSEKDEPGCTAILAVVLMVIGFVLIGLDIKSRIEKRFEQIEQRIERLEKR